MKLFDCNHFAHVIVLWQMQKILVLLHRFCFVSFCIWGQFLSTSSHGLYSEGQFNGGFFLRYEFGVLNLEGLIFWIFTYFASFCSEVSGLKSKLGKVPMSVYTSVIKLSELEYTSRHTLTYSCTDRPLQAKQSFYRTAKTFSCLYKFISLSDDPIQVEESHYKARIICNTRRFSLSQYRTKVVFIGIGNSD